MKLSKKVSGARRKQRKAHFTADSNLRRIRMSAPLSKELREKHGIKRLPVRRGDEVVVRRGRQRDREGKIINVYRRKWSIYVERITREKTSGESVNIPLKTQNVVLTKLRLDDRRKAMIERKVNANNARLASLKAKADAAMQD